MGWKEWQWSEKDDQEMTELYAALGMQYRPRRKSAASARIDREQRGGCVVLRPSWPQKEGKGAWQEKQLNGFALETKVALVSKEGFQAASKTAVQKGKVNGHPLKTKATVQRPQPIAKASQDERKPNEAPGVFLGR
jgi:hypothetical protein